MTGQESECIDLDAHQLSLKGLMSRKLGFRKRASSECAEEAEEFKSCLSKLSDAMTNLEDRCCAVEDGPELSLLPGRERIGGTRGLLAEPL